MHPPPGWIPITDSRIVQDGYNVINAALPVIQSDGRVLWQDGMDTNVRVATPAETCQAKAAGATILMSIRGAARRHRPQLLDGGRPVRGHDRADSEGLQRRRHRRRHRDRADGSGNTNTLSTSQADLIGIVDGVLAQVPSNFGLTMAPEITYVTGGSVTDRSIWARTCRSSRSTWTTAGCGG